MTKHTAKALPAESGAPSERPETWGEFYARLTPEELSDWYDPEITEAELDEAFGMSFEEQYKKLTGKNLPATAKPETQGDLWKEIAEEGYDRTYTQEELDRAFGMPFEEQYKKLTGKDLPATAKQETQGDLWKEIAEEGYDSMDGAWETLAQRRKARETESAAAPTAPIIEDGKTLDELVKGDTFGESLTKWLRSQGATDQEIWQFMLDN